MKYCHGYLAIANYLRILTIQKKFNYSEKFWQVEICDSELWFFKELISFFLKC